jgi:hypothetical protein
METISLEAGKFTHSPATDARVGPVIVLPVCNSGVTVDTGTETDRTKTCHTHTSLKAFLTKLFTTAIQR